MKRFGIPESKVTVIHPGYDPKRFKPDDRLMGTPLRNELGVGKDELLVGLITSGDFKKRGVGIFLASLRRLPEEIKELTRRKQQVREDLRVTLQKYLETLDVFEGSYQVDKEDDLSDLFQSIQIPGDGEDSDREDIDKINMDLS